MKDFNTIPRYRTLYAVLKFLLECKEKSIAEAAEDAVKEYQKYTVLEQHLAKEKMISSVRIE